MALSQPLDGILREPPPRGSRWTLYTIAGLFGALLIWAIFARLDVVTVAEGKLVPQSLVKIVQPAEGGVIREILVHDGDAVGAGQVLVRMNTDIIDADRQSNEAELKLRELSLRRIDAELVGKELTRRSTDDSLLFQQVLAQYAAHRQAYLDNIAQQNAVLMKATYDLRSAHEQLRKLRDTVPTYKQSAEAYRKLAKEGFVNELAAKEKERDFIEKEQDLKAQESNTESLNATLDQSKRKIDQATSDYRSQLQNERVDNQNQAQKLQQEKQKGTYRSGLYELRATQDGIVKDLATTTVGAVISPGTVLLNLVPRDEPLVADVQIKNEDVGFLVSGLPVKVKLAAYPFQKYGMAEGTVSRIAPDTTDAPQQKNAATVAPPAYRAEIKLRAQQLVAPSGERLSLSAGMLVAAEIRQRDRTVLEYLLSPVERIAKEAGRER